MKNSLHFSIILLSNTVSKIKLFIAKVDIELFYIKDSVIKEFGFHVKSNTKSFGLIILLIVILF
jgi:hypothetical protein